MRLQHKPPSSLDDDVEVLQITETELRTHTRLSTLRDSTARHVPHDDCCGYCERFCHDKITAVRRREIQAWRQEVDDNMDHEHLVHAQKTKKPPSKTRPPRHPSATTLGVPDSDPGFRRIKTPKDLREKPKRMPKAKSYWSYSKSRHTIDVTDVSAMTPDSSREASQIPGDIDHFPRRTLSRSTGSSMDFSRDSLDEDDDDDDTTTQVTSPSSQHSYRSYSNRLLNVLTIDDAIQNHRDRLIRNKVTADDDQSQQSNGTAQHSTPGGEFRLHESRPVSKYSATSTLAESVELRLPGSANTTNTLRQRHNNNNGEKVIIRAVNAAERPGSQMSDNTKSSKRFQKMNRSLRDLVDREYVPDRYMARRLQKFSHIVDRGASGRPVTAATGMRGNRSRVATTDTDHTAPQRAADGQSPEDRGSPVDSMGSPAQTGISEDKHNSADRHGSADKDSSEDKHDSTDKNSPTEKDCPLPEDISTPPLINGPSGNQKGGFLVMLAEMQENGEEAESDISGTLG